MSLKELRDKDDSHLASELTEKMKHLFELRTQAVTEKLEDPTQLKKARREIARIKTIQRQRVLDGQKSQAAQPAQA